MEVLLNQSKLQACWENQEDWQSSISSAGKLRDTNFRYKLPEFGNFYKVVAVGMFFPSQTIFNCACGLLTDYCSLRSITKGSVTGRKGYVRSN